MMRRALRTGAAAAAIVASVTFAPIPATGQAASVVRAVEHPEYSRLVLPLAAGADWALDQDGDRATLRLIGSGTQYDVSGIFARMPRTRIRAADTRAIPGGAEIGLDLACSCEIEVSPIGSGFLAVDVRRLDRAEPGGAPRFLRPDESVATAEGTPAPTAPTDETPLVPVDAAPGSAPTAAVEQPKTGAEDTIAEAAPPAPAERAATDGADPVLEAREALMRQLNRAVAEGLLTAGPLALTEVAPPAETQADTAKPTSPMADAPPDGPRAPGEPALTAAEPALEAHITVRDAEDPARRRLTAEAPPPRACIADPSLDARGWLAADKDFAGGVAALRRTLVAPSGDVDHKAVGDLARHYIGAGFGREAAALLDTLGEGVGDRALLADLAEVIEGRAPADAGPLALSEDCVGRVSLWRAAAGLERFDPKDERQEAARKAFTELPPQLRYLLGHALARQSLTDGDGAAARAVLDLLDRAPDRPTAEDRAVRAWTLLEEGKAEAALALTAPVVEGGRAAAPELLLLHGRAVLAAEAPVTPGFLTALDAAIFAVPDRVETGRTLRLARIRLEHARGRPLRALAAVEQLAQADAEAGPDRQRAVQTLALDILEGLPLPLRGSDQGAQAILAMDPILGQGERSAAVRQSYAEALLDGGLPNVALSLLAGPDRLRDRETLMLRAAAYTAVADWSAAITTLDGVEGQDAATLAAAAHLGRSDVAGAYAAVAGTEGEGRRDTLGFLAGAWSEVDTDQIDAPYQALANHAQSLAGAERSGSAPTRDAAAAALARAAALEAALAQLPAGRTETGEDG